MTATPMPFDGVLLDMDGTLVDSREAVEAAWHIWAVECGLDPAAVVANIHGHSAQASIRRFLPGLDDDGVQHQALVQLDRECELLDGVRASSGAPELIAWMERSRVPWAVVTNAPRRLAQARLSAAGIEPPTVVAVEDVAAAKPAPDGYLLGADLIRVGIEHVLVVEDSTAGVQAGQAAGAVTVSVGTHVPADLQFDSLVELLVWARMRA